MSNVQINEQNISKIIGIEEEYVPTFDKDDPRNLLGFKHSDALLFDSTDQFLSQKVYDQLFVGRNLEDFEDDDDLHNLANSLDDLSYGSFY